MLLVETPGLLTTVQDLGRPGYGAEGISASGAGDPVALRLQVRRDAVTGPVRFIR